MKYFLQFTAMLTFTVATSWAVGASPLMENLIGSFTHTALGDTQRGNLLMAITLAMFIPAILLFVMMSGMELLNTAKDNFPSMVMLMLASAFLAVTFTALANPEDGTNPLYPVITAFFFIYVGLQLQLQAYREQLRNPAPAYVRRH